MRRFLSLLMLLAGVATLHAAMVTDSVLMIDAGEKLSPRQFEGRDDFHTVRFRGAVAQLPECVFSNCGRLRKAILPRGMKKIGRGAFSWCTALENVQLPVGLDDIASQAFAYCSALKEITLPAPVKHIGANCFSMCRELESIILPASVDELESYAFSDCTNLRSAVLPANPRQLGELLFSGCGNLREITVDSTTPPPFECDSAPFDAAEETHIYNQCALRVPAAVQGSYAKARGWNLFRKILPL